MANNAVLSQLGAELDNLERKIDAGDASFVTSLQHHRARGKYFGALREKSFIDLKRVEGGPYSRGRYDRALRLAEQTKRHLATIEDLYDLGVCSAREQCEAVAAEERAGMIFEALRDKRSWLRASRGSPGKRRLVSNGCIRTGRYRVIDGVRIPVMRDVQ